MPAYSKLLIASSKGGVGKSTTAVGLAVAFSRQYKKVLLIDTDIASRSLDMLLDAEDTTVSDFADVIEGDDVKDVAVSVSPADDIDNLSLIPACSIDRLRFVSSKLGLTMHEAMRKGIESILESTDYDVFICDTGGGVEYACDFADLFDLTLVVSEQGKTSVRAADYASAQLEDAGAKRIRLVVCSFDLQAVKKEKRAGIIEIIDASSLPCVGVVPFDKKLQWIQDRGKLPEVNSPTTIAYSNIAKRISGYDVRLFEGMKSFFGKRHKIL